MEESGDKSKKRDYDDYINNDCSSHDGASDCSSHDGASDCSSHDGASDCSGSEVNNLSKLEKILKNYIGGLADDYDFTVEDFAKMFIRPELNSTIYRHSEDGELEDIDAKMVVIDSDGNIVYELDDENDPNLQNYIPGSDHMDGKLWINVKPIS